MRRPGVRADIQALRATAVSLVLVYHLAPWRLSGGFVGVDVFFVISGFLITSHLVSSPPRRTRDLFAFWSRRIRRLLPASLLVLAAALAVTRTVAPQTLWLETAQQVRAAALYALNWNLAAQHVDYLSPAQPPTPVQHFWSLSVEEQFYLGWPVLLLLVFLLARLIRVRGITLVIVVLAAVVGASLAWSVHATATNASAAYFATPTRVWELGIGGLLAAVVSGRGRGLVQHNVARVVVAWLGLIAVVIAATQYTDATPFPGWRALLPVLGTVAVIAADAPRGAGSPVTPMAWRPVQYLGDISYSVYLWHWPLLILLPSVLHSARGHLVNIAIVAASIVLAALTKLLVEDRFRDARWGRPVVKPYAVAAVAMSLVVVAAQVVADRIVAQQHRVEHEVVAAVQHKVPCFGAAALDPAVTDCVAHTRSGPLTPTPVEARRERSDVWQTRSDGQNCFAHPEPFEVITCHFGDPHATTSVALVGNSHMAQWVPAIRAIAEQRGWRLTTYVAIRCSFVDVRQKFATKAASRGCRSWYQGVSTRLRSGSFDLVVLTNLRLMRAVATPDERMTDTYEQGYERTLRALRAMHLPVAVLADTPFPRTESVTNCLAEHPQDYSPCDGTRTDWLRHPELGIAARAVADPGVTFIDLTRYFCIGEVCPAVIGRVPVYFDISHISRAYALTLAPYLSPKLAAALV